MESDFIPYSKTHAAKAQMKATFNTWKNKWKWDLCFTLCLPKISIFI